MKNLTANSFGNVSSRREIAGLNLKETSYAPHLNLPFHSHEQPYLCLVLKGNYEEVYSDRKMRFCQTSTLIFHPAGEKHSNRFADSGGTCFDIQPDAEWLKRINFDGSVEPLSGNIKNLAYRLYSEYARYDQFSPLAIEGLFLEIAAEILRSKAAKKTAAANWLKRVREILHEQFAEDLTVEKLASEVSVHPVYLARVFRQKFQCTIGDYLRNLRIEYARREISDSSKSLTEIAYLAGFSSQSHFTTVFKRFTGITPSEFRKKS